MKPGLEILLAMQGEAQSNTYNFGWNDWDQATDNNGGEGGSGPNDDEYDDDGDNDD